MTNLIYHLSSGHIEVVKLLASHGAEVACKDKKSYTPLHAAASSGMISVVKYLLDLGVDVSWWLYAAGSQFLMHISHV